MLVLNANSKRIMMLDVNEFNATPIICHGGTETTEISPLQDVPGLKKGIIPYTNQKVEWITIET